MCLIRAVWYWRCATFFGCASRADCMVEPCRDGTVQQPCARRVVRPDMVEQGVDSSKYGELCPACRTALVEHHGGSLFWDSGVKLGDPSRPSANPAQVPWDAAMQARLDKGEILGQGGREGEEVVKVAGVRDGDETIALAKGCIEKLKAKGQWPPAGEDESS